MSSQGSAVAPGDGLPGQEVGGAVPAVTVSCAPKLCSSMLARSWISKRREKPSLGFHRDCSTRGFSWSATTRKHSLRHRLSSPV